MNTATPVLTIPFIRKYHDIGRSFVRVSSSTPTLYSYAAVRLGYGTRRLVIRVLNTKLNIQHALVQKKKKKKIF